MNVRFFAGTKAEYLSLPTPRNPLGLYFCEDTKELFWADRLLTDGIRVVPTFADLPARADAVAEGVVYYVTETRNGYVLSPDRSEWLQTIYAPATDAYKVPESEIYNTVTTVGAVRDIEAKIYKTIDERIANIEIGTSGNGVKAIYFAGRKLDAHDDGTYHIDRLCALNALGFKLPEGQEDTEIELVTKKYVDELIAKIPGADLDLSSYVKQEDITNLATKEELQEAIDAIEHPSIDLTGYAKVEDIPDVSGFIKEIPEEYITADELAAEGFLKEHQDLSEYAKKVDIPSVEGLASESYVDTKIAEINIPDTSNFITNEQFTTVQEQVNNIQETYVTNTTLEEKNYVTEQFVTNNYVTNETIVANYSTKEEIAQTYVTNTEVTELVTNEVTTVVSEQIENQVTEVIEKKIEGGNLVVNADAINYDTW